VGVDQDNVEIAKEYGDTAGTESNELALMSLKGMAEQ
jgi:hypothetical protein